MPVFPVRPLRISPQLGAVSRSMRRASKIVSRSMTMESSFAVAPAPSSATSTATPSSVYPCASSHRGLSGSQGTVAKRMNENRSWNAMGNRQAMLPDMKLKPYVIQLLREKPAMFILKNDVREARFRINRGRIHHLENDEFASPRRFGRFALPYWCGGRVDAKICDMSTCPIYAREFQTHPLPTPARRNYVNSACSSHIRMTYQLSAARLSSALHRRRTFEELPLSTL